MSTKPKKKVISIDNVRTIIETNLNEALDHISQSRTFSPNCCCFEDDLDEIEYHIQNAKEAFNWINKNTELKYDP